MSEKLHEARLRLKALFLRKRMDRDMAEELDFHQEMLRAKLARQGVPQSQIDASARRRFGDSRRWHERLRELWQFRTLESLLRDLGFSIRLLSKSPGFTCVALLTLALGVGANTTVFSMINGLLLRPLAVPESDRLAIIGMHLGGPRIAYSFPAPFFRSLERRHDVFQQTFAFDHAEFQVKSGSSNEIVYGQFVSGDFFPALQTAPMLGRTLERDDDRTGGNSSGFAAVISEGFWQSWFNRAPDVIGRKLQIDNVAFTVAGVMPKRFIGADPMQRPEIFVPLATEPVLDGERSMTAAGYHGWWLTVMGRVNSGVTIDQANSWVGSVSHAVLEESVPDAKWIADRESRHFQFSAEPGSAGFTYIRLQFRKPLVAVFAMCGGILLLACLNLASLLMARGSARQRELATRLAMGASRRRLIQQLMVESLVLGVTGTLLGLIMAPFVSRSLAALLLSGQRDAHLDTSLDIRIFGFATLAAIAATLLFGFVPAIQATSRNLIDRIKDGQHATLANERRRILPRVLMSVEVGLALTLVVGAGLLVSSLVRLYRSGTGFDPRGVENISFSMDKLNLDDDASVRFYRQMQEGLERTPGVKVVSFALMIPLTGAQWDYDFVAADGSIHDIFLNSIGPRYFEAMHIPMIAGRDFTWNDGKQEAPSIILNQSAARTLLPGENALGKTVTVKRGEKKFPYLVAGIVGDAKYEDMRTPPEPAAYFPMTQEDEHGPSYNAVVRVDGSSAPLAGAARALANRLAPSIPAPVLISMSGVVDESMSTERMMALLSAFFAACALTVTAIGLYGTLAYSTARRTGEIGIRMALGARRNQVITLIFGQNLAIVGAGTVVGIVAAMLSSRALSTFLYATSTRDVWVVAVSILALAVISAAASLLPALRAARIEPMSAIRCE